MGGLGVWRGPQVALGGSPWTGVAMYGCAVDGRICARNEAVMRGSYGHVTRSLRKGVPRRIKASHAHGETVADTRPVDTMSPGRLPRREK